MIRLIHSLDSKNNRDAGFVSIVGAGPGDAELLTIKAIKALQEADIVLFDWLVDKSILALLGEKTETEFVGKRCGKHSMHQDVICDLMVKHALSGKRVVRLKGGDPAIFARTVEETQALEKHNVEYCIIPGITAASGASASSGIPLTHRDYSQSVIFTTASLKNVDSEPNWKELVHKSAKQTLVFYMGLGKLNLIVNRLKEYGLEDSFPIAVIDNACTINQSVMTGTLHDIVRKSICNQIQGPAIIICGEVVQHRQNVSAITTQALGKYALNTTESALA